MPSETWTNETVGGHPCDIFMPEEPNPYGYVLLYLHGVHEQRMVDNIVFQTLFQRYGLPVVTFIDTPGAYPGIDAEERGQSEAIARSISLMADLKVPIVSVVIGEGGSGGALAVAVWARAHWRISFEDSSRLHCFLTLKRQLETSIKANSI